MINRELASHLKFLQAAPAKVFSTADVTGDTIDMRGYDAVLIAVNIGNAVSVGAASYVTLRLQHTDASALGAGPSDFAYCASIDMLRFDADAAATAAVTSGTWFSITSTAYSGTVQFIAYVGDKRYVRLTEEITGTLASGGSVGLVTAAVAILFKAGTWPVQSPTAQPGA